MAIIQITMGSGLNHWPVACIGPEAKGKGQVSIGGEKLPIKPTGHSSLKAKFTFTSGSLLSSPMWNVLLPTLLQIKLTKESPS